MWATGSKLVVGPPARPGGLLLSATGFVLGMVQAAVLSYLPLFTIQALGFDKIGAGFLVAASQAGGAVSRLALGAASDRWFAGRRSFWLTFDRRGGRDHLHGLRALGGHLAAHRGRARLRDRHRRRRLGRHLLRDQRGGGGPRQAGLLSGVAFAAIVLGLLVGPPVFGLLLEAANSSRRVGRLPGLSASSVVALVAGAAIDRESRHR